MRLRSRKLRRKGTVRKAHSGREQARTVIQIKARAKLNLTLDVLGRRDDGYHEIKSVMQSLTLADTLTVERIREGIEVVAEPGVPQGADNLVFQAVEALRRRIPFTAGVRITIEKEIPIAAGLGGGSSDAAAALLAVNHLLHLGLTVGQLLAVGQTLGSDVPFCLLGGTALAQGRGEKLTPLTAPP
ncbi:MAG: 4-(cytidine 5'-diphospho)-2-C-methyl-D-erythritol kinase, partial [Clostridia bacterium]|nr:4-(cytidine 5'-diphospho)-2-C-methyl-D-erythritol kinase [Clostridia bacterium]